MSSTRRTLLVLAVALLSACGTTVTQTTGLPASGGSGLTPAGAVAEPASPALGRTPTAAGPAGSAAPAGTARNGPVAVDGAGSRQGLSDGNGAAPTTTGPVKGFGFDAKTVYVGILTNDDVDTATKYGVKGTSATPIADMAAPVIRAMNAAGGMLGRQFVPLYYDVKTSDVVTQADTTGQAACAYFTQDHQVFAVFDTALGSNVMYRCLAAKHVQVFTAGAGAVYDGREMASYAPYLFGVLTTDFGRSLQLLVRRGIARGALRSGNKIGLLFDQHPVNRRGHDALIAELRRHGLTVAADETYNISQLNEAQQQISAAVLKMKSAGVDRVFHDSFASSLSFMTTAESQQYRPRYLINSIMAPPLLESNVPPAQLAGAVGIGWLPSADVDAAQSPGILSQAQAACARLYAAAGRSYAGNTNDERTARSLCDAFQLLVQTSAALGHMSSSSIADGLRTVRFESAAVFSSGFGPGQYTQAETSRDLGYDGACGCFRFLDKVNRAN